ncbi:PAS domain-containing protein [Clostridium fermenticellae]|uniref:HTH-type transcriptional regulatory protein TyrR n=1 Tax=Clostridium fermenticellae TaxID=2068654 RepID=A0A386H3B4_9CLOT|nr:sigma 54-interacting transcriptional regulator [Clostridium fermenticellae]AYD40199.1 PAS domain-containing protein [Clostridium fermenticellae]
MNKYLFKIDKILKSNLSDLKDLENIEVDATTFEILNFYKSKIGENCNKMNLRVFDAFDVGNAISDGMCLVDDKGIVIAINKGYTEITEIKEEEIVGRNIRELLDKEYFSEAVSFKVLKQKKKISALSTINKNNKKVLITGNPFLSENGEIIQILTVMRDLTEIIKLKNDLEKVEKTSKKYLNELEYFRNKYWEKENLVGEDDKMKDIKELIGHVAKTDATVLITGETGSGKEVVAKEIHDKSDRKGMPYIKVNCAAIPDTLIESELFGYEKGAFTGAQNKEKLGMFEIANGGTILLDEIGEMPLNLQSKFLRVLQEKEIMRLGGTKSIKIDVRVIASTNQNLKASIEKGKFREDLFYRLNVVPIKIPPLRERQKDISILSHLFLGKFNIKYGKSKSFEDTAVRTLQNYNWPGNVRELQNVIERLLVMDDQSYITCSSVQNVLGINNDSEVKIGADNLNLKSAINLLEKEMIGKALKKYGSTYKAAKVLGVTQPTVFRKAKALGIKLNNK